MPTDPTALAETIANAPGSDVAHGSASLISLSTRTTVLPRLAGVTAQPTPAPQRFVPIRELGRGGLGEVTLVQDNDIDRTVALKRLRAEQSSDEVVFRFAQEIRTAGKLDPGQRFQSTSEMIAHLYRVLGGHFAVQCPVTFMKRVGGSGVRLADRRPMLAMTGTLALVALVGFALVELVRLFL